MFLLEEKDKLLAGWTFDILATDLNDNSLEAARAGIYGEYALRSTSARCAGNTSRMLAKKNSRPTIC
jgi:chemotaxis methyl-accepting protein methylase